MDGSDYIAYCKDCDTSWSEDMLTVDMVPKVRYVTETCGLETWDDHEKYVYEVFPDGKVVNGRSTVYGYQNPIGVADWQNQLT